MRHSYKIQHNGTEEGDVEVTWEKSKPILRKLYWRYQKKGNRLKMSYKENVIHCEEVKKPAQGKRTSRLQNLMISQTSQE